MPADLEMKKETILNAVKQFENDAVIITHLIDKEEKEAFTRGGRAHGGYYGSYHSRYTYSYARDPGYSSTSIPDPILWCEYRENHHPVVRQKRSGGQQQHGRGTPAKQAG